MHVHAQREVEQQKEEQGSLESRLANSSRHLDRNFRSPSARFEQADSKRNDAHSIHTMHGEMSAVAQGTVSPRRALSNNDLEQQPPTAYLSARTALKRARKSFERTDGTRVSQNVHFGGMGNTAAGQTSLCESIGGTGAGLSGSFERSGAHWRQRGRLERPF